MQPEHKPCPNGTLIGNASGAIVLAPSRCRRWACEHCGKVKARRLCRRAARTPARRLITLTYRRKRHETPQEALDILNAAWRTIWKRIRRSQGPNARGYLRVVELTKAGVPHLHIAVDCGYVPQARLSVWMAQLTGSPIVDVRRVKSSRGLSRYLAKYLSKAEAAVPGRRKWAATPRWLPPEEPPPLEPGELAIEWRWVKGQDDIVMAQYLISGWTIAPVSSLVLQPP